MEVKRQWVVLTYYEAKDTPGARLSPSGVKEKQNQGIRWIFNYIFTYINTKYLPIATLFTIQYGRDLDLLIREMVISDPDLGSIYVFKYYVSNGIYHIALRPGGDPNLGLVLPSA